MCPSPFTKLVIPLQTKKSGPGMVTHSWHPSTQEAEAGGVHVQGQLRLHRRRGLKTHTAVMVRRNPLWHIHVPMDKDSIMMTKTQNNWNVKLRCIHTLRYVIKYYDYVTVKYSCAPHRTFWSMTDCMYCGVLTPLHHQAGGGVAQW
jgi:hypothetical protein